MTLDPRLGYRDGDGIITTVPTQFYDGTAAQQDILNTATRVSLDTNYFVVLRPGTATLTDAERSALLVVMGSSGVVGSITSTQSDLGIEPVGNVGFFDDFLGSTLSTDSWTVDVNGTGAAATQPNNTGLSLLTLALGTTDDGHATAASDLTFLSSGDKLYFEARVSISAVTELILEMGFSDAQTEAGGIAFSSHDSTPVAVATNAALFGFQHDSGGEQNTVWNAVSVKAGVAARVATTVAPVATTYVDFVLVLAKNGSVVDAAWFIDGVSVATDQDIIANSIPLYVWLSGKTKSTAARTVNFDYVRAYLKR